MSGSSNHYPPIPSIVILYLYTCIYLNSNDIGLKTENSLLTGESHSVSGNSIPSPPGTSLSEAKCMIFNGSLCLEGFCLGVVTRTGNNTVFGQIAKITAQTYKAQSNMEREVNYFIRFVTYLAVCMGIIVFAIAVWRLRGRKALDIFIHGFLGIIIANIPQGLPATVTSILNIIANKMAILNVFVKRIEIVETLGSVSLLASDKTGTLTKNEMTVTQVYYDNVSLILLP